MVAVRRLKNPFSGWINSLGVYREAPVLALFFLGFSSGLPLNLTFASLSVWLTEEGISRSAIGLFAAVGTPYALKFLWAPLLDRARLPFLTGRLGMRRSWMLASQVALVFAIFALGGADPAISPGRTALLALLVAFLSATQDIVIDAYRVESLKPDRLAAGAAALVFGYRVALLVAGAGTLYLATYAGWAVAYGVMGLLMLVGIITTLLRGEPERSGAEQELAEQQAAVDRWIGARPRLAAWRRVSAVSGWLYVAVAAPFAEFLQRKSWLLILLFVALYKFGDSLAGVMTNPFLVSIGFTKVEIANVAKLYGFAASMIGLAFGGAMMNGLGLYRSLWICGVLQLVSNFMFAVQAMVGADLSLLAVTIGFENLAGGMGTAVFVAYLSNLCNVAYTATQYALFSSFMAVARTWLSASAGFIADALDWVGFFLLTAGAAVPGLLLLWLLTRHLPEISPQPETADAR